MKTLIITTKKEDNCYEKIRKKWFNDPERICVKPDAVLSQHNVQLLNNIVLYVQTKDFRLCLPNCINPQLKLNDRIEYALSLICAIAQEFSVSKQDLYVLFHSGDLYDLSDPNRKTGPQRFNDIYAKENRMDIFKSIVDENHLFCFSHTSCIWHMILYPGTNSISTLCAGIIDKIENR